MESPHMHSSLWSHLPEQLIELVLARLPVANLLRLRTVCKKWKDLMSTKCFLEACLDGTPYERYFAKVAYREEGCSLMSYQPSIPRWYYVSIAYFPPAVGFPLSSAGGLICFANNLAGVPCRFGPMLFVSNPMTKAWKELPCGFPWERRERRPVYMIPVVSMVIWKRPSHYKVIVVGDGSTQIFDSVDGEWRNTKCVLREEILRKEIFHEEVLNVHNKAHCNGRLYLLTPSNRTLMAFSIKNEVWSRVETGRLPGHRKSRNLTTCNGHIVIVGKFMRQQVVSVCVWFLEWKTMRWLEGGRMPQHMSHYMSDALRSSSLIRFSSYGDSIFFDSGRHGLSFLFNMAKGTWCAVEHFSNSWHSIAYEPRLDAQV